MKYGKYANIFAEKMWVHLQKLLTFFFSKNTCELDTVLTRTVNILTTNELIKLTMLWTTGLWCVNIEELKQRSYLGVVKLNIKDPDKITQLDFSAQLNA